MRLLLRSDWITLDLVFSMMMLGGQGCSKAKTDESELARAPSLNAGSIQGTWYVLSRIPTYLDRNVENMTVDIKVKERTQLDLVWNFEKVPPDLGPDVKSQELTTWKFSGSIGEGSQATRWRIYPIAPFFLNFQVVEYSGDYSWLILGRANRSLVWELSKTPHMEPELFQGILKRLEEFKFDISALKTNKELVKSAI